MATEKQKSAWSLVTTALRNGILVRKRCECGSRGYSLAHHEDYSKPLDVEFKCYKCHREAHHLEHLAFLGNYPECIETDEERYVLIETAWDECMRMIETKGSVKGVLQTSLI